MPQPEDFTIGSWTDVVQNNPLRLVDPNGLLAVDARLATLYPKAAAFISNMTARKPTEYNAYRRIGGIHALKLNVDRTFTPGAGPVFKIEKFTPDITGKGILAQYHSPQNTGIDPLVLNTFESGVFGGKMWLEAVVKHEVAEYFDSLDGTQDFDEPGDTFEKEVYGRKIGDSLEHAAECEAAGCAGGGRGSLGGQRRGANDLSFDELRQMEQSAYNQMVAESRARRSR